MSEQKHLIPSQPFPDPFNAPMARVDEYWWEKCAAADPGPFPRVKDINLMDLHDIADHLLLGDVVRKEGHATRYRWRFWGSKLATYFGMEMTGRFIDEGYTPDATRQITAAYDWIVANREPHFWLRRSGLAFEDQNHLAYERLIFPVLGETDEIDHLFGIITFVAPPALKVEAVERPVGGKIDFSDVE